MRQSGTASPCFALPQNASSASNTHPCAGAVQFDIVERSMQASLEWQFFRELGLRRASPLQSPTLHSTGQPPNPYDLAAALIVNIGSQNRARPVASRAHARPTSASVHLRHRVASSRWAAGACRTPGRLLRHPRPRRRYTCIFTPIYRES